MKRAKKRDFRRIPVRFNYWFDGKALKVTLRPGAKINLHACRRTDEGYRTDNVTLSLENRTIIEQYCFTQRDCDGIYRDAGERHCHVNDRAKQRVAGSLGEKRDRRSYPKFNTTKAEIYDQFAEMAGY